jgi:NCS1 nucleoside transporter family
LHAVNTDVPGWAGILIIAIITAAICTFGYKIVHAYEFWSWIPTTIIFFVLIGEYAQTDAFYNIPMYSGKAELGACLSFGATVFGFATGWTSYAADYTVYQPSHTSKKKVFFWTWLGLIIPLLFTEMLGLAVACAANQSETDPNFYQIAYNEGGIGGLLGSVMFPDTFGSAKRGFGKFCLVVLALSIIANNCPNIYSVALTMQMIGKWAQKVPRFVWTIIGTACYIAIAIPGYSHFEEYLEDFLNFIGYWLAIYQSIAFVDHFWFRRGFKGYNPEDYDNPKALPPGIAAVSAFCVGVAGMVLGMSQVFWVGPIALTAGEAPYGGDVGFELGALFAATSYLVFRTIEKRIFGR